MNCFNQTDRTPLADANAAFRAFEKLHDMFFDPENLQGYFAPDTYAPESPDHYGAIDDSMNEIVKHMHLMLLDLITFTERLPQNGELYEETLKSLGYLREYAEDLETELSRIYNPNPPAWCRRCNAMIDYGARYCAACQQWHDDQDDNQDA